MSISREPYDPRRGRRDPAGGLRAIAILTLWLISAGGAPAQERAAAPALDRERTAVAIVLERRRLPPIEAMQSWFLLRGEPLRVLAVEKGPADVVVIRDPKVQPALDLLARYAAARERETRGRRTASRAGGRGGRVAAPGDERWDLLLRQPDEDRFIATARDLFLTRRGPPPDRELAAVYDALRRTCRLGEGARLRFLSPQAAPVSKIAQPANIFNLSPSIPAKSKGFLTFVQAAPELPFTTRFADAAWLIGQALHNGGRRRAVLMLIESGSSDESFHRGPLVRSTLERLQVPVYVWSFGTGAMSGQWDARLLSETSVARYEKRSLQILESACKELEQELETQRIVWLAGRQPAAMITLGAEAVGIRLAGKVPPREERE